MERQADATLRDAGSTTGRTAVIAEMAQARRTGMQTGTKSVLQSNSVGRFHFHW
jgi:N-dimethylarginine dimethylaminohydrolase